MKKVIVFAYARVSICTHILGEGNKISVFFWISKGPHQIISGYVAFHVSRQAFPLPFVLECLPKTVTPSAQLSGRVLGYRVAV